MMHFRLTKKNLTKLKSNMQLIYNNAANTNLKNIEVGTKKYSTLTCRRIKSRLFIISSYAA